MRLLLFFFIFATFLTPRPTQAISLSSCLHSLEMFMEKPARALSKNFILIPAKKVGQAFKKLNHSSRITLLKFFMSLRKNSPVLNQAFLDLIRSGYRDDLLSIHDIRELVKSYQRAPRRSFFHSSNIEQLLSQLEADFYSQGAEARKFLEQNLNRFFKEKGLSKNIKRNYLRYLGPMNLSEVETERLIGSLSQLESPPLSQNDLEKLVDYIDFSRSLGKKRSLIALQETHRLFDPSYQILRERNERFWEWRALAGQFIPEPLFLRRVPALRRLNVHPQSPREKFILEERIIHKKITKELPKKLKKLRKNNPSWSESQLKRVAFHHADQHGKVLKRIRNSCRADRLSAEHSSSRQSFQKLSIVGGMGIGMATYFSEHYNEEKSPEWYGRFAFEFVSYILGYGIEGFASANKFDPFIKKLGLAFGGSVFHGYTTSKAYNFAFDDSDEMANLILKEVLQGQEDPALALRDAFLHQLRDIDDATKAQTLLTEIENRLKSLPQNPEKASKALPQQEEEKLLELISDAFYLASSGDSTLPGLHTGDPGMDRFWFYRYWSVGATPLGLLINLKIYDFLCRGKHSPRMAFLKATALFIVSKIIIEKSVFSLREQAINQ